MLTVGFVGCGTVVHLMYAAALRGRADYAVRYVSDVSPQQAESAARLFDADVVPVNDLIERSGAVVVTTPPETHAALLKQCLRPGKIVLCEKPFATSYRDAVEISREAANVGSHLYVGHFRRTFPQLRLARSLVQLGVIGDVTTIFVSEGGRFTWKAVSDYTVKHATGGVVWDTAPHTLDMALFGAGVDGWTDCNVTSVEVTRDKPEPSHDFRARFLIAGGQPLREIACRMHVSRKEALPNFVKLSGERGSVAFSAGMDRHVRLTTSSGSVVLSSEEQHTDLMECFDLQMRRILLRDQDQDFASERFLALTRVLEALAHG